MRDKILQAFLERQFEQVTELACASDIVELAPEDANPPQRYVARFHCTGLVVNPPPEPLFRASGLPVASGVAVEIEEAHRFDVGIWLPDDYLRRVDPQSIVAVFTPRNIWHPNVRDWAICLGHLMPGTPLVDIVYQIYEVLTYQKWAAHDGLNPEACEWARNNQHRFPLDRRPLKRKVAMGGEG